MGQRKILCSCPFSFSCSNFGNTLWRLSASVVRSQNRKRIGELKGSETRLMVSTNSDVDNLNRWESKKEEKEEGRVRFGHRKRRCAPARSIFAIISAAMCRFLSLFSSRSWLLLELLELHTAIFYPRSWIRTHEPPTFCVLLIAKPRERGRKEGRSRCGTTEGIQRESGRG